MINWHNQVRSFLRHYRREQLEREPFLHSRIDEWAVQRPKYRGSNEMLLDPQILNDPAKKSWADQLRHHLRASLNRAAISQRMPIEDMFQIVRVGPELWEIQTPSDVVAFNAVQKRIDGFVRNKQRGLDRVMRGINANDPMMAVLVDGINQEKQNLADLQATTEFLFKRYALRAEENRERIRGIIEANPQLLQLASPTQRRILGLPAPGEYEEDLDEEDEGNGTGED